MPGASVAPRVTQGAINNVGETIVASTSSVIVYGVMLSSSGLVGFKFQDGAGNDISPENSFLFLSSDTTGNFF